MSASNIPDTLVGRGLLALDKTPLGRAINSKLEPVARVMNRQANGPSFLEYAAQATSSTEAGYNVLADSFDGTVFYTGSVAPVELARVIDAAGPVSTALDLGTGTGAGIGFLRSHVKDKIVGLDLSEGMLEQARAKFGQAKSPSVELVHGSFLAAPIQEKFDLITIFGAIGHVRERDERNFLAEVKRLLKPGGRFVFETMSDAKVGKGEAIAEQVFTAVMGVRNLIPGPKFDMDYRRFHAESARRLLEQAGFEVKQHPTSREPFVIIEATLPKQAPR